MTWNLPYKCLTCGNKMDVYPRVPCADVFCSKCGISQFQHVVWVGQGHEPKPIPSNDRQKRERLLALFWGRSKTRIHHSIKERAVMPNSQYQDTTAYYFKCGSCAHLFTSRQEEGYCPNCGQKNTWKQPKSSKGFSNLIFTTRRVEK